MSRRVRALTALGGVSPFARSNNWKNVLLLHMQMTPRRFSPFFQLARTIRPGKDSNLRYWTDARREAVENL